MNKRESYIFYRNWWESFRNLPNDLRLEIYDGIMQYAFEGENNELSIVAEGFVNIARPLLDKDRAKYESICERNKLNGSKGGRPKTQTKPRETQENPLGSLGYISETQNNPKKPYNDKMINDKVINNNIESNDSLSVSTDSDDKVDYVSVVDFFNKSVKGRNMPACIKLTEKRKQAIRARIKEYGIEKVFEAITKCAESDFCNGHNDRNWKADFEFVFNANKMAKILEGKYDNEVWNYGRSRKSNEQNAREVGESALRDIFAEMEERRRTEGTTD